MTPAPPSLAAFGSPPMGKYNRRTRLTVKHAFAARWVARQGDAYLPRPAPGHALHAVARAPGAPDL